MKIDLPENAIGFETSEDCAVFPLDDDHFLLQSVDFFPPIVDDPYLFGQIAATNSLSDIYAMGGTPLHALNIAEFPSEDLPLDILSRIFEGGLDIIFKSDEDYDKSLKLLIDNGIDEVFIASKDPNPDINGKGINILLRLR